jgi:hypothetical protein
MSSTKYSQLHRRLLFHWTGPKPSGPVRKRADREKYLDLLCSILQSGLRYSVPGEENTEWIVENEIGATHPMLCFSEWGVGESSSHSGRYGFMGLGFTRKFVMKSGGRPVVYLPNEEKDRFQKAIIEIIRHVRRSESAGLKIQGHADLVASYLKAYHFKTIGRKSGSPSNGKTSPGKLPKPQEDDRHLKLDFGGIFANLEDREWRIASPVKEKESCHLGFDPGQLAMIVFPDHQTLGLAMRHPAIMDWIHRDDKPSVCLISREMIMSF